jgi:hypothetical protein
LNVEGWDGGWKATLWKGKGKWLVRDEGKWRVPRRGDPAGAAAGLQGVERKRETMNREEGNVGES